jgi:hypothetical protein
MDSSMRQTGRFRWSIVLLLAVLALGGAGAAAIYRFSQQLEPQPALYAPGVVTDPQALDRALSSPVARSYLGGFDTQETWSSCGPSSAVNVLQSLGRSVSGEGALFDGEPLAELRMRLTGMNLDEVADLLRDQGVGEVTILRDLGFEQFLEHLKRSNDPDNRYVVNFDRKPIFGVSIPHFSPIGGFDPQSGLVTLLDVTPGYGPSLVPARLLYEGVQTRDYATGRWRGLIRVEPDGRPATAPDPADLKGARTGWSGE